MNRGHDERERIGYVEAAKAARATFARAREAEPALTAREWRMLTAVVDLTALYSRMMDRVSHKQLQKLAGISDSRTVRRLLHKLADRGLIVYVPGRGAPSDREPARNFSAVGLLPVFVKGGGADPLSDLASSDEKGGDPDAKRGAIPTRKGGREGPPHPGRLPGTLSEQNGAGNEDRTSTTNEAPTDPLAARLYEVCERRGPEVAREAAAVVEHFRPHVDERVIDQAIGFASSELRDRPRLPRAVAPMIASQARSRGIPAPDFKARSHG